MKTLRSFCTISLFSFLITNSLSAQNQCKSHDHPTPVQPGDRLGFVENKGQWESPVLYKASLGNLNALFLEAATFTYVFHDEKQSNDLHELFYHSKAEQYPVDGHAYKVHFLGANTTSELQGVEQRPTLFSFFQGNDAAKWAGGVHVFDKVRYTHLYPLIHLEAYGEGKNFKYDFIVEPGGDVSQIQLQYEGVSQLQLRNGQLIVGTSVETIHELAPVAYQIVADKKQIVACEYQLSNNPASVGTSILTFHFPDGYNKQLPLVIDPVVLAATLSGSTISKNFGHTATFDNAGNIYTGGISFGTGYPAGTGAFQTDFAGGEIDICISKYNPTGTQMLYATYIGGSNKDYPQSMIADFSGQLYIYGSTNSANYPTTSNAFQSSIGGDFDIVVSKLNPDGSQLVGSTFLGGTGNDGHNNSSHFVNYGDTFRGEIILDAQNNAYIASNSASSNFPVSDNAFDQSYNNNPGSAFLHQDAVVAKLNSDLSFLYWASYLGGDGPDTGAGLRVDDDNNVYVTGTAWASNFPNAGGGYQNNHLGGDEDAYVALISADGSTLLRSTFFGTTENEHAYFLDVDELGNVHIYGQTTGSITPAPAGTFSTNNNSPQFLAAFDKTLSNLVYKTNIGNGELPPNVSLFQFVPVAFMVDKCNNIYFSGYYAEAGLPTTPDAIEPNGGNSFYLGVLEPFATGLSYGTYYGNADHVDGGTSRFDKSGTVYQGVCSCTWSGSVLNTNANAWSSGTDLDCDVGVFKIDFEVPTVTAAAFASPGTSGCLPFTVNFTYTGQDAEQFSWDFGDGSSSTVMNPNHTFTETGSFDITLIASSPNTCNIADTFYLQIDVLDGNTTLQDTAICEGVTTIFLDATTLNAQYTWQDGSTGATYPVTNTGVYWVEVDIGTCSRIDSFIVSAATNLDLDLGDDFSVCDQSSFTVQPNVSGPVESYLWSSGSTASTLQINQSGTYSLWVTDTVGCVMEDEVNVLFGTTPQFDLGEFDTLCLGETITLDVSMPDVTYLWQDGSTSPTYTVSSSGIYSVTLNNNGCTSSDDANIVYFNQPVYNAYSTNIVCSGECNGTLVFETDVANLLLLWEDGSNAPLRENLCEGDYSLTITDEEGCTYEENFTILNPDPLDFSLSAAPVICYGDGNGIIEVIGLSGGFPPYQFIINGDTFPDTTPLDNFSGGSYEFIVSDSGGCTLGDTVFIYEPPYIYLFAGDDRRVDLGDTVHVNGYVYPSSDQELSWSPITQFIACLDCPKPVVQPIETIQHVFTAVDSITGCVRSDSVWLYVDKVREVYIPNAFSPNFDGVNDFFMIYAGPGVQQINSFKIFDRWGELIIQLNNFQPNDFHYGWNGTFKGQDMNNAVFVYVAEILFIDGEELLYAGDVTLLR
jgi:gliding motility-associated-like protein